MLSLLQKQRVKLQQESIILTSTIIETAKRPRDCDIASVKLAYKSVLYANSCT